MSIFEELLGSTVQKIGGSLSGKKEPDNTMTVDTGEFVSKIDPDKEGLVEEGSEVLVEKTTGLADKVFDSPEKGLDLKNILESDHKPIKDIVQDITKSEHKSILDSPDVLQKEKSVIKHIDATKVDTDDLERKYDELLKRMDTNPNITYYGPKYTPGQAQRPDHSYSSKFGSIQDGIIKEPQRFKSQSSSLNRTNHLILLNEILNDRNFNPFEKERLLRNFKIERQYPFQAKSISKLKELGIYYPSDKEYTELNNEVSLLRDLEKKRIRRGERLTSKYIDGVVSKLILLDPFEISQSVSKEIIQKEADSKTEEFTPADELLEIYKKLPDINEGDVDDFIKTIYNLSSEVKKKYINQYGFNNWIASVFPRAKKFLLETEKDDFIKKYPLIKSLIDMESLSFKEADELIVDPDLFKKELVPAVPMEAMEADFSQEADVPAIPMEAMEEDVPADDPQDDFTDFIKKIEVRNAFEQLIKEQLQQINPDQDLRLLKDYSTELIDLRRSQDILKKELDAARELKNQRTPNDFEQNRRFMIFNQTQDRLDDVKEKIDEIKQKYDDELRLKQARGRQKLSKDRKDKSYKESDEKKKHDIDKFLSGKLKYKEINPKINIKINNLNGKSY